MIPYVKHQVDPADESAVLRALRSPSLTMGPEVEGFEDDLCRLSGAPFAICCASGTQALELLYLALPAEATVQVPCITFAATANAAVRAGRRVTFRDCEPVTGLAPDASPSRTSVYVTLGGQPAPREWAGIVDAAHGPIRHHPGALATILSFHPAKHVAAGEGGAVLTSDPVLSNRLRQLRNAGRDSSGDQVLLGTNGRLSELQAALGRSQLTRYHAGVTRRQLIALAYDDAFETLRHCRPVPHHPDSARHLYQLLVPAAKRDVVQTRLRARQVGTQILYRSVLDHSWWSAHHHERAEWFPGAVQHAAQTLAIPLFPSLTDDQVDYVIRAVKEVDATL